MRERNLTFYSPNNRKRSLIKKLSKEFTEVEKLDRHVKKINCVECLGTGKSLFENETCPECEGKKFSYRIDF